MSVSIGRRLAAAHPGDGDETDAEHAKEDLASTSIKQIEKETAANAAKIKKATGDTPGRRTRRSERSQRQSLGCRSPGCRPGRSLELGAVHQCRADLPGGAAQRQGADVGFGGTGRAGVRCRTIPSPGPWCGIPPTNTSVRKDVAGYNIFCAGYTQLADGRVLVAGGNKNAALDGIVQTHIFDWRTETWSRGPDMAAARWYPAVQALGNDEAVIVGGGPAVPEVYQTDGTLRRLTNASGYSDRLYPFLTTRPDGQVQLMGPPGQMNTINTSGTGAITATQTRDSINRTYGGFATYDIGKVLVAGGGDMTEGGQSHVPTKTAVIVNVNGGSTTVTPDRINVGRAAPAQPHHSGRRQRARDRRNEPRDQRERRSRQPGVRRGAVGSSDRRRGRFCRVPAAYANTTPAPRCCPTAGYSPAAAESALPASAWDIWRRTSSTSSRPTSSRRTAAGSRRPGR